MKQEKTNSRRNFLSSLAILTSGTVVAGSPLPLFNSNHAGETSLRAKWNLLVTKYGATSFLNLAGIEVPCALPVIAGQSHKVGEMVSLAKENLLAQPTWIYWGNNRSQPNDVVVTFFSGTYPYTRIKSINRFELLALVQLPCENNLLSAICTKQGTVSHRLEVKTRIAKGKTIQNVQLHANNDIVFNQQFFYNV